MKKGTKASKKKRGRPFLGLTIPIVLRLKPEMLKEIDVWRAKKQVNRQAAIRLLIRRGLNQGIYAIDD